MCLTLDADSHGFLMSCRRSPFPQARPRLLPYGGYHDFKGEEGIKQDLASTTTSYHVMTLARPPSSLQKSALGLKRVHKLQGAGGSSASPVALPYDRLNRQSIETVHTTPGRPRPPAFHLQTPPGFASERGRACRDKKLDGQLVVDAFLAFVCFNNLLKKIENMAKDHAAIAASLWLLLTLCSCADVAALSPALSLPDPAIVNSLLRTNYYNWSNPALGGSNRTLQLIRCQSVASGPLYDFYQVEAPSYACQYPPPIVTEFLPKQAKTARRWLSIAVYLSVIISGMVLFEIGWGVALIGLFIAGGLLLLILACMVGCCVGCIKPPVEKPENQTGKGKGRTKDKTEGARELAGPSQTLKGSGADQSKVEKNKITDPSSLFESMKSEIGWTNTEIIADQIQPTPRRKEFDLFLNSFSLEDLEAGLKETVKSSDDISKESTTVTTKPEQSEPNQPPETSDTCLKSKAVKKPQKKRSPFGQFLVRLTQLLSVLVFLALLVLAVYAIPGTVRCFIDDVTVHRVGPVPLPDPAQYLTLQPGFANVTLKRCVTDNLQFSVGVTETCGQLGDPYGGHSPVGEPTRVQRVCPPGFDFISMMVTLTPLVILLSEFVAVCAFAPKGGPDCDCKMCTKTKREFEERTKGTQTQWEERGEPSA